MRKCNGIAATLCSADNSPSTCKVGKTNASLRGEGASAELQRPGKDYTESAKLEGLLYKGLRGLLSTFKFFYPKFSVYYRESFVHLENSCLVYNGHNEGPVNVTASRNPSQTPPHTSVLGILACLAFSNPQFCLFNSGRPAALLAFPFPVLCLRNFLGSIN